MTPQLWVGLGFLLVLVAFLMITFLRKDTASANQWKNMRILSALCAGFAGGFLTGDAIFRLDQEMPGGVKFAISGTAGIALFFTVWFTYGRVTPPPLKDHVVLSILDGWTFEQAARQIVKAADGIIHFEGFRPDQLAAPLPATNLDAPTTEVALANLRYQSSVLPEYRVEQVHGVFHIRAPEPPIRTADA